MAVILSRTYAGFASGATATFDAATEAAIVAQNIGAYVATGGVNPAAAPVFTPSAAIAAGLYGPSVVTNIALGSIAMTGYETNGVAHTAWNTYISEIFVPHWATWTGAQFINGTGVGTDTEVLYLFNSSGYLVQNTAIAGTTNAAGASVWEQVAFTVPVTLSPGRYFVGLSLSGTTVTPRHVLTAFGAQPRCAQLATITSHAVVRASFVAAPITVPTTFTTALAPICGLYQ